MSFALTTSQPTNPPPQCPETNGVKFLQRPNIDGGLDVLDSQGVVLADDFVCTNTGPITDIHIWGSWRQDQVDPNPTFWLGIYDDVPATNGPTIIPSHPGTNLLWQQWFGPGQYAQSLYGTGSEQFYDPRPPFSLTPERQAYYYCFFPTNPFVQLGSTSQPTIYWLSVYAQLQTTMAFGWKTSLDRFQDDAVWGQWTGVPPTGGWTELRDPTNNSLNLSFKLTTPTNQPPPCCPDTNVVKFLQRPNVINGLDVLASYDMTLADDFLCTNSGPITDIHIWGSWQQDSVDTNTSFSLGIWSDIPAVTNGANRMPSHPGTLLWTRSFAPGEYVQCLYTNGSEQFYDPSLPQIIGSDTQMYYLCFFPTNPFFQQGSTSFPTNYWLSVNAQPSPTAGRLFGWKTSSDKYNDDAVWFKGPNPPPPNANWNEMFNLQGQSLNLAFKITTVTNCPQPVGNPTVSLATNTITITWSSGVLQRADNILGPWTDVPAAVSPYSFTVPSSPPYRFYRVRCKL
jgi:hypothetical protein